MKHNAETAITTITNRSNQKKRIKQLLDIHIEKRYNEPKRKDSDKKGCRHVRGVDQSVGKKYKYRVKKGVFVMEKVEIRFHATALHATAFNNMATHALHGVTLHVVKGGHNRFIGNFESIDKAVLYALNNNFEIVGLVKDDFQC